jgi:hypothetical protein
MTRIAMRTPKTGTNGMAHEALDLPLPFPDLPREAAGPRSSTVDDASAAGAATTLAAHEAKGRGRAADTIWRRNPRDQGVIGVTDALAWFAANGWHVCLPLIDNQPYDLVVDDGRGLQSVQVKTTTYSPRGVYVVQLATHGGNQRRYTSKDFDPTHVDLLYVLTDARERYLIPANAVRSRTNLSLGQRVAAFRLP